MAELVNLNKARKARGKADDRAKAAENRAKFGRTKLEKGLEGARQAKAGRELDGKKRHR